MPTVELKTKIGFFVKLEKKRANLHVKNGKRQRAKIFERTQSTLT